MLEVRNEIRVLARRRIGSCIVFANYLVVLSGLGMYLDTLLLIHAAMGCVGRELDRFRFLGWSFDWGPAANAARNHTGHCGRRAKGRAGQ